MTGGRKNSLGNLVTIRGKMARIEAHGHEDRIAMTNYEKIKICRTSVVGR